MITISKYVFIQLFSKVSNWATHFNVRPTDIASDCHGRRTGKNWVQIHLKLSSDEFEIQFRFKLTFLVFTWLIKNWNIICSTKNQQFFGKYFGWKAHWFRIKNVESIKENKLSSIWQKNCCSYPTGEIEWSHLLFGDSSPIEQRGNSDWSRRSSQDDGRSIDRNDVTTFQTTTKDRYSMNL